MSHGARHHLDWPLVQTFARLHPHDLEHNTSGIEGKRRVRRELRGRFVHLLRRLAGLGLLGLVRRRLVRQDVLDLGLRLEVLDLLLQSADLALEAALLARTLLEVLDLLLQNADLALEAPLLARTLCELQSKLLDRELWHVLHTLQASTRLTRICYLSPNG